MVQVQKKLISISASQTLAMLRERADLEVSFES